MDAKPPVCPVTPPRERERVKKLAKYRRDAEYRKEIIARARKYEVENTAKYPVYKRLRYVTNRVVLMRGKIDHYSKRIEECERELLKLLAEKEKLKAKWDVIRAERKSPAASGSPADSLPPLPDL